MTYKVEDALRQRIIAALRDAFPDRAADMADQVTRWFTRHWRNEPFDPIPDGERCRLCDLSRRYSTRTWGSRGGEVLAGGGMPLCSDCVRDAYRLVSDDRYPGRDMVRLEALRALRAEGLEEAADFVEQIANAFPDLVRENGSCERCGGKERALARGARTRLCGECLGRLKEEFGLGPQP